VTVCSPWSWGDALFKILPRFTLPGSEQQAGGLVALCQEKLLI